MVAYRIIRPVAVIPRSVIARSSSFHRVVTHSRVAARSSFDGIITSITVDSIIASTGIDQVVAAIAIDVIVMAVNPFFIVTELNRVRHIRLCLCSDPVQCISAVSLVNDVSSIGGKAGFDLTSAMPEFKTLIAQVCELLVSKCYCTDIGKLIYSEGINRLCSEINIDPLAAFPGICGSECIGINRVVKPRTSYAVI